MIEWASLTNAFAAVDLARLRKLAEGSPQRATAALGRARRVREALHDVFTALIGKKVVPARAEGGGSRLAQGDRPHAPCAGRAPNRTGARRGSQQPRLHRRCGRHRGNGADTRLSARSGAHVLGGEMRLAVPRHIQGRQARVVRYGHVRGRGEEPAISGTAKALARAGHQEAQEKNRKATSGSALTAPVSSASNRSGGCGPKAAIS
jgi:hypothetical protein